MVPQNVVSLKGKFTNLFFLSTFLSRAFKTLLVLVVVMALILVSFWIFPQWYCLDCGILPQECSKDYTSIVANGDVALCSRITTFTPRWEYDNYCAERCKSDIAIEQTDSELCERIQRLPSGSQARPSLRDICFTRVAGALGRTDLCKLAENLAEQEACMKSP